MRCHLIELNFRMLRTNRNNDKYMCILSWSILPRKILVTHLGLCLPWCYLHLISNVKITKNFLCQQILWFVIFFSPGGYRNCSFLPPTKNLIYSEQSVVTRWHFLSFSGLLRTKMTSSVWFQRNFIEWIKSNPIPLWKIDWF